MKINVTDTGPGIPEAKLESVFEGFKQADNSVTRKFGGTGLGLSISRSLARLMGGELQLESKLGEGTVAKLILPFKPATLPMPDSHEPKSHLPVGKLRVMAVDDVSMNLELLEMGLGKFGHSVHGFLSAHDALASLRDGDMYDVILMDVQMPEFDGIAAARAIRALPGHARNLPIVALTANVLPDQIALCIAAGMTDHAAKPIDILHLNVLISSLSPAKALPVSETGPKQFVDDPLEKLKLKYKEYLAGIPSEFATILNQEDRRTALKEIRNLCHSIAGSAGSFGFGEVSEAAFSLEYIAQETSKSGQFTDELVDSLSEFIRVTEQVVA